MPESKNNFVVDGLTGSFAGIGTFHRRGGKTFLRKIRAKPTVPDSEKQIAIKKRFAGFIQYAKAAIKDPVIKAMYAAAAKPGRTAFNRAVTDAYHPPKIGNFILDHYRGRPGDSLMVEAKDDFKVVAVSISIHDPSGDLVEQGEAVIQVNEHDWLFVARVPNERWVGSRITATAADMPGNKTSKTVVLL